MSTIRQDDLIQSVADALQFISYYHPRDYIDALWRAPTSASRSPAAKDAIAQILTNSRMCAEGHRPICQDTGIVIVFLKVGMDVRFEDSRRCRSRTLVNEGVRRAYTRPGQPAARLGARRPGLRAQEHQGQHAGGDQRGAGARRQGRGDRRRQGRRLGEQVEVRDAQSLRLDRRLGAEDRADHGRRLVPAGHARHRHRRHRREGDADGQGSADGADRHGRAEGARAEDARSRNCASSSTTRSTRSASARRAWAACPPCST